MRRNAVRSIGAESSLFDQKELEQLYAVFKVILITKLKKVLLLYGFSCPFCGALQQSCLVFIAINRQQKLPFVIS